MAAKSTTRRKSAVLSGRQKLRAMLKERNALSRRLTKLQEAIEDHEDHLAIEEAKKRNGNRPLVSWEEAKKRLGLKF